MTDEEIYHIIDTWVNWYEMHGVKVDREVFTASPKPKGYNFPILNAREMPADQVNEVFKDRISSYNLMPATAPIKRGVIKPSGDAEKTEWQTLTFTDLTSPNDRTSEKGSYVFWVKRHFRVRQDGSFKRRSFDTRMTVEEAMLYHLFWFWRYDFRYLGHHYSDFHHCSGSKGCCGLRWDLQDIKVCLD